MKNTAYQAKKIALAFSERLVAGTPLTVNKSVTILGMPQIPGGTEKQPRESYCYEILPRPRNLIGRD